MNSQSALNWIGIIFAERFGHPWRLERFEEGLRLSLPGAEGAIVFDSPQEAFSRPSATYPCAWWDAQGEGWHSALTDCLPAPIIDRLPRPLVEVRPIQKVTLVHYDIPGLTYWMLARIEELDQRDLDRHQRFPASASHAHKHNYLDRPIVDEWLYVLGQIIERQWPGIVLKRHKFQVFASHDVDRPSLYAFRPWKAIGRLMARSLIHNYHPKECLNAAYVKICSRKNLLTSDPYNTFDWLMETSESNGLRSAFYFICGRTDPEKDADYEIENPVIRRLLRGIHRRGHEIGLHPSYHAFRDPNQLRNEASRLRKVCVEEGIHQTAWGGRTHYLRWQQPLTLRAFADAGMSYENTLGYADRPGFRCGTCHEYPAFDAELQHQLPIRSRPLIVMETTVIASQYMGLDLGQGAEDILLGLRRTCERVQGTFSILWHNSSLTQEHARLLYLRTISSAHDV